ncbi:MAG: protein translocase subunit SecD [Acidobacteriota bacterium]
MNRKLQYRLIVILVVVLASVYMYFANGINLGLDLRGGIHLVLQVETQEALSVEVNQVRERLEAKLREASLSFDEVRVTPDLKIEVAGLDANQRVEAEGVLENNAVNWTYRRLPGREGLDYRLEMNVAARKALTDLTVRQVRDIVQNRVDQYGVAEPTIQIYGETNDQIIVELPGVEDFDRVVDIIRNTAKLELKLVHPDHNQAFPTREAARAVFGGSLPSDYEMLPFRDRDNPSAATQFRVVRKVAALTGQHLKNARRSEDPFTGRSEVVFFLNSEGVRLFSETTGENVNNLLAIVLDGEIRSAPRIESKISTESARITGNFTPEQAEDLALVLRSGALPASIRILENRSVGPSLGLDSIRSGVSASALGMALVVVGMLLFYRLSGVNAVACLLLNLLLLLGFLAYFRATLTLPGIAGVILTIGMAVDANILIFERIKEELKLGKTVRSAVDAGFGRVFSTIIDTNVTTLVAALFLFQFGTGPVRGFAVTLAIGLLANIFTATFVSRTFFSLFLQRREIANLSI